MFTTKNAAWLARWFAAGKVGCSIFLNSNHERMDGLQTSYSSPGWSSMSNYGFVRSLDMRVCAITTATLSGRFDNGDLNLLQPAAPRDYRHTRLSQISRFMKA